ncbi:MAG: 3-deoxy-7-phosphoheptulonate synthase [Planctomycetes bacterium]|nr:3-deoxy-7-phosphoheptulonate synthase [Planctomycetota bacterium]
MNPTPSTSSRATQDLHVQSTTPLISPAELDKKIELTEDVRQTVLESRDAIKQVLLGQDPRLIAIVGPCSIHDEKAALEYAGRLAEVQREVASTMLIVMRVYFEKPRTTVGWKGLIYDPHLDDSFDINAGLHAARRILLAVNKLGLPAATEFLDPIVPQYIDDLVSWAAIGARTTESQTHRQMASGLSMPVGYKNSTTGELQVAIDAMISARSPHAFLGIDHHGRSCIVQTTGNKWGHVILRGGPGQPNYEPAAVAAAAARLQKAGLSPTLMVDCSHANSGKKFERQEVVFNSVIAQRTAGNAQIIGLMLESNLFEGRQELCPDLAKMRYGVSVTDECLGWEKTAELLRSAHATLS